MQQCTTQVWFLFRTQAFLSCLLGSNDIHLSSCSAPPPAHLKPNHHCHQRDSANPVALPNCSNPSIGSSTLSSESKWLVIARNVPDLPTSPAFFFILPEISSPLSQLPPTSLKKGSCSFMLLGLYWCYSLWLKSVPHTPIELVNNHSSSVCNLDFTFPKLFPSISGGYWSCPHYTGLLAYYLYLIYLFTPYTV